MTRPRGGAPLARLAGGVQAPIDVALLGLLYGLDAWLGPTPGTLWMLPFLFLIAGQFLQIGAHAYTWAPGQRSGSPW